MEHDGIAFLEGGSLAHPNQTTITTTTISRRKNWYGTQRYLEKKENSE